MNKESDGVEQRGSLAIKNPKNAFNNSVCNHSKTNLIEQLLRRPEVNWNMLETLYTDGSIPDYSHEVIEQIVTDIKYAGYLQREESRGSAKQKISPHQDSKEHGLFLT